MPFLTPRCAAKLILPDKCATNSKRLRNTGVENMEHFLCIKISTFAKINFKCWIKLGRKYFKIFASGWQKNQLNLVNLKTP
jgi:hypothetical protein